MFVLNLVFRQIDITRTFNWLLLLMMI